MEDPYQSIRKELQAFDARLRRIEYNQRILDADIRAIENSRIFRLLRWLGRPLLEWKARTPSAVNDDEYALWVDRENASRPRVEFGVRPLFSFLLYVSSPTRKWLETTTDSVLKQTYPHWELCVCDDSGESWIRDYFSGKSESVPAIRVVHSTEHLGPAEAWNRARTLATGGYFLFLNQHGALSPDALHYAAESLQDIPTADVIYADEDLYADEDRLDQVGRRVQPIFKPDWSPNLLLSCMYLTGMLLVRRDAMERAGGLRTEFDGAEIYDLVLRITDRPAVVRHVSRVLYHGRISPEGAQDHAAGRRALEDTVRRRGWRASIEDGEKPNQHHIRWHLAGQPMVTLVICSRSAKQLGRCLGAIRSHTAYPHRQIVVVQHVAGNQEALESLLIRHEVKRVRYEGLFNFSRMNNLGAEAADGEILVFLNDDVEPIASSWLSDLAAQAQRPEVGAVGAKLLYPSGSFQHAGVAIGIQDGAGHPGRGMYAAQHWPWIGLTRDVSAVTGACIAMRKEVFGQLGGFDELFPVNYNDVDLCLRARQAGFRVVFESGAVLRHYECQTRGRSKVEFAERARWLGRWISQLESGDPFYNRQLTRMGEDLGLNLEQPNLERPNADAAS